MHRFAPTAIVLSAALVACSTPSPSSTGSAGASASGAGSTGPSLPGSPAQSAPASGAPSPTATPPTGTPPFFVAGDPVETAASSLRVRSRPGTTQQILVQSLPLGADLLVVLGPVAVDGYGWYLVRDFDLAEPTFDQGWVASGFEPNPWLVHAAFEVEENPFIAGYAFNRDGEFGPVLLQAGSAYYIDWVASPPTSSGCSFAVDLVPGAGSAVSAIRATIGASVAPGRLQQQFFAYHPELVGDIFVRVTSTCHWALTFVLVQG